MSPSIPIYTQHNVDYAHVREVSPGLFRAQAVNDCRLEAYGTTQGEALRKLTAKIETAEDRAA